MSVTISEDAAKASAFIKTHPVGVLATANSTGYPHAATIYVVADDELNLYFVTKEETTKHKNLQQNPLAAIAIYDAGSQTTLQADGRIEVIKDTNKFMDLFSQILDKSSKTSSSDRPPVSKLFAGDYFMYCLRPESLRLAEYTKPDRGDQDLFRVIT